jgi:fatty-acyl-CoA synthase
VVSHWGVNLANTVRYWVKREPSRTTFFLPEREVSWGEFDERTSRLAQGLMGLGIEAGDRVALLTPNRIEFCETVLAALKCGAITVPLNFRLAPREVREVIDRAGCKLLVTERSLFDALSEAGVPHPPVVTIGERANGTVGFELLISTSQNLDPLVEVAPEHPAFICFTSGTTGFPKGVVLSHRNVMAAAVERMLCNGWGVKDVGFLPYAIAFTGGLVGMWMPLYISGAQTVLEPTFDADHALDLIENHQITAFIAVASVWEAVVASPRFEVSDLSSLTTAGTGGMYVSDHLIRSLERKGIALAQGYGLTEGGGNNLILPAKQALSRIGFAGLPSPQCETRIAGDDGHECAPEEVGELLFKGPQVMERYWDDPEATAETLVDGWLHTGDLALSDADGYIKIVDRKKDMLISGGINVYPAEIERVLAEVPDLTELVVIGVPDARWGEVPAVIACRGTNISEEELIAMCRKSLASYKVPKHVIFRDEPLPRGMSGKVMKRELHTEYAARWSR